MTSAKREKGSLAPPHNRSSASHAIPKRLCELILAPSNSTEWFGFTEQGIGALYSLVEQPDLLCTDIIKKMAGKIFNLNATSEDEIDSMANLLSNVEIGSESNSRPSASNEYSRKLNSFSLSQLIFLIGHVSIKQIVHLENIESEWKRRKHLKDAENEKKPRGDLEMVTGSLEDEFVEKIALVRERELLYGPTSLLGVFGPIITNICLHPHKFNVIFFNERILFFKQSR